MISKSIRSDKVSPVTALEFYNALIQLWRGSRRYARQPQPGKLGLAVSGGGDSMALAYLCKQLVSERLIPGLSVQAFVVDHQARKESTEEANKVSGWLKDIGLQSRILTLQWPKGSIPSELSDFETQARRFRYQALGTACRDNGIPALLLGHHLDDNIETVIMRLSQGQQGMGLKGVPNIGLLPECHGIYGVSGSGGTMDLVGIRSRSAGSNVDAKTESGSAYDEQMAISDGGISILRPFNSFPKTRLLATCADNGVPFVTDPTNFDFALTPRNTVRYLLSSHRLPQTFQPPSILKMIEEGKAMEERLTATSNSILRELRTINFDRRSGKLLIQFPHSLETAVSDPKIQDNLTKGSTSVGQEKASALSIRRILDLVSPSEDSSVRLEDCQQLLDKIFTKRNATEETTGPSPDKFTLGGVQFQRVKSNAKSPQPNNTWLLTRELFRSTQTKPITTINLPEKHSHNTLNSSHWSDWHLWDNRYWIRVQPNTRNNNITIRPLEESDLSYIRQNPTLITTRQNIHAQGTNGHYTRIKREKFNRLLSDSAPGRIRYTLPVLAEATGQKRVLALPTLGIVLPSPEVVLSATSSQGTVAHHPNSQPSIKWEIMYKRVDPEVLELTQTVV